MNIKNIFKSKFKIATTIIAICVIIFGLLAPNTSHALFGIETAVAKGIFQLLVDIIRTVLNWLLLAAAAFFDGMLDVGFTKNTDAIMEGWKMARDISNMFFILLMVVVAFGTILRSEKYGVKKLLPKIIGIALLINFSMVFCGAIVDISNVAGEAFIKEIRKGANGEGAISATFADAFEVGSNQMTFTDCEDYKVHVTNLCNTKLKNLPGGIENCLKNVERNYRDCQADGEIVVETQDETFINILLSGIVGSIVMMIAVFTLFAGGILLLIRVVAIWLLIAISPLAFMCYIVPGLDSNWKKWWSKFINYCIFAPVYAFFVWLAVKFAQSSAAQKIAQSTSALPTGKWSTSSTMLIITPGQQLIQYLLIAAFLVGGLIVAKQLGMAGADSIMKIATSAKKGATDWAKRKTTGMAKEYGTMGAGVATQGIGKVLKNVPGFKSTGRRMESSGKLLKQKATETKELAAYRKRLALMSKEDIIAEIKTAHLRPSFKLAAVQEAQKRGDIYKTKDRDAVRSSVNVLRSYGYEKEAGDLEERRFSSIKDRAKRRETAKKVKVKNLHKELKPVVFEGTEGYQAAADFASLEPTVSAAIETAKQMQLDTQKTYARGLLATFINNNDFSDQENIKLRSIYAAITGQLQHAFRDGITGGVDATSLGTFVKSMKPRDFMEIDPRSIPDIAEFVETTAANDIGRNISTAMKQAFVDKWKRLAADPNPIVRTKFTTLLTDLGNNPNWKSLI
jgi:hypothetical protein